MSQIEDGGEAQKVYVLFHLMLPRDARILGVYSSLDGAKDAAALETVKQAGPSYKLYWEGTETSPSRVEDVVLDAPAPGGLFEIYEKQII